MTVLPLRTAASYSSDEETTRVNRSLFLSLTWRGVMADRVLHMNVRPGDLVTLDAQGVGDELLQRVTKGHRGRWDVTQVTYSGPGENTYTVDLSTELPLRIRAPQQIDNASTPRPDFTEQTRQQIMEALASNGVAELRPVPLMEGFSASNGEWEDVGPEEVMQSLRDMYPEPVGMPVRAHDENGPATLSVTVDAGRNALTVHRGTHILRLDLSDVLRLMFGGEGSPVVEAPATPAPETAPRRGRRRATGGIS